MRILLACEESQAVCIEFRRLGHKAFSCDTQPCSGGHPLWHIQCDLFEIIDLKWDMMIAFPPCTHLAVSGAAWFEEKIKDGRQQEGIDFFNKIIQAPIEKIAVENPIGIMSNLYRKPDQIIHPFYFGDPEPKATCLWLKNLPKLQHFPQDDLFNKKTWVEPEYIISSTGKKYSAVHWSGGGSGKERSKTYPGVAQAMAEQWGK